MIPTRLRRIKLADGIKAISSADLKIGRLCWIFRVGPAFAKAEKSVGGMRSGEARGAGGFAETWPHGWL